MGLEHFHFLRPLWLLLIPLLLVLLWLMYKRRLGSRSWEAVCDSQLLPYMLIGGNSRARRAPLILLGICALLSIVSLAGPVWEKLPQPVFKRQTALVLALDLSRSMDANDISPSRLSRARFKITDILKQHGEGQAALLVYAGDAFTVTPLTDDMATIISQLPALTTDIMPGQGNRTDLALSKAEELLKGAGHSQGDILLLTDEVNFSSLQEQVSDLRQQAYRVSILGIGSPHGAPVVLADGSFLKDAQGEIVIPVLDEKSLRELANAGGGFYRKITPDDSDINYLLANIEQNAATEEEVATEFETDSWREQGPWLLLLLLPLAALAFRKGYLLGILILLLPVPENAQAFDWDSLWLRADQRASRELQAGNAESAAALFRDPAWKGAAQYRAGDFAGSLESLQEQQDVDALYNKGNALARLGRYEQAIAAYEEVLKQDPGHEDASFNKTVVEKELQQQQQQKQDQQDQQDQQEQDKQNQQQGEQDHQQEQQQSDQQQDEQSQQDQQQSDQQQGEQSQQEQQQEEQNQSQQNQSEQEEQEQQDEAPEDKAQKAGEDPQQDEQQEREAEQQQPASADEDERSEEQQATEQWLRRIPDDPAGLLRRKFRYQYQQRQNPPSTEEKTW